MRYLFSIIILPLAVGGIMPYAPPGSNPDPVDIKEWEVPWASTRPRDPFVDGEGRVWFCGQGGGYLAYLDPATGEFKRYEMYPGAAPHNLIVDHEGFVWYAGNRSAHIGRLDPGTGEITKFPMPDPEARDPHTLIFDRNGDIWFTLQGSNMIGHLAVETGEVRLVRVPTDRARPYGIKLDSQGRAWIVLFGTNKLAVVDPMTMALQEITLPNEATRPRRLEITSDDRVYFVDYARGFLGRYDPASRAYSEWASPGGSGARAYGTALDDRGRIWFVESGLRPNKLVGFDPHTEEFLGETEIPSGGGTVRHMYFHAPTRTIWFGTDTNYIGRAMVP